MTNEIVSIFLNSTNQDPLQSNRFIYKFPSNAQFSKNDKVSLQGVSMYNSIFNIESSRANNKFSLMWNADTSVQYDFTILDGNYSVSDLNYQLQFFCVENGLYMTNANNDNIYFAEFLVNP